MTVFLQEAKAETTRYLGREPTEEEWAWAVQKASRKLRHIIQREGDADGARSLPWYFGKLAEEAIQERTFTDYFDIVSAAYRVADAAAKEKTASVESGPFTAKPVYQILSDTVNQ